MGVSEQEKAQLFSVRAANDDHDRCKAASGTRWVD